MDTERITQDFFARYRDALLRRDEHAVAELYAVPGLILFPEQAIPVADPAETERFFAAAWGQYEGVDTIDAAIAVVASTEASIWADVTWRHEGTARERFVYQLVPHGDDWAIAVLTPLDLD